MRVEELGYDSLWVWDHILLGVDPHFPILDSLTTLTAIAARTSKIKLGTGILVLPLRNPVALAKQLSSMDQFSGGRLLMGMASGWYKREFDAMGIPFEKRGKLMDENLEIMRRLWSEPMVDGKYLAHDISAAVMYPKPAQQPTLPILIGRLRRQGSPARSDCRRRLADLLLFARGVRKIVGQASQLCEGRRQGSRQATQRFAVADHDRPVQGRSAGRNE